MKKFMKKVVKAARKVSKRYDEWGMRAAEKVIDNPTFKTVGGYISWLVCGVTYTLGIFILFCKTIQCINSILKKHENKRKGPTRA